jgi:hypothetical protein
LEVIMNTKHFLHIGLVAAGISAAVISPACGGSSSATGGTTSSTSTTASSTTATTAATTSSTTTTTGTGGAGGVGSTTGTGGATGGSGGAGGGMAPPTPNTSFAKAQALTVNGMAFDGQLPDAMTADYYSFTATAGERLYIAANAVSLFNPAPPADETNILDTVVTLYASDMKTVLAQDDDGYPRQNSDSQLFFEAPTAGTNTYYFTVESCTQAFGATACGNEMPTIFAYQTFVADVGKLNGMTEGSLKYSIEEIYAGTMQNGTTANAVAIDYTVATNEITPLPVVDGDSFTAAANTQVFSFTVPAALTATGGGRLRTEFWLQPTGQTGQPSPNNIDNGDGSAGNVTAWITDMTGTTILAQADQKNYKDGDDFTDGPLDLTVPVTAGSSYYLFVQDDNAAPGAGDYYFFVHTIDSGNPLQTADTNISAATAQVLTPPTGETAYFVDGDMTALAPTKFWYEVDPLVNTSSVFASCSALRSGSGVQGLTIDVQAVINGAAPVTIVTGNPAPATVETATSDLSVPLQTATSGLAIPTGTTKVYLVVSAVSQSTMVTGTSYQCVVSYE